MPYEHDLLVRDVTHSHVEAAKVLLNLLLSTATDITHWYVTSLICASRGMTDWYVT